LGGYLDRILFYKGDIKASIVVFLVALPLCLGVALASGAPLMSGILAGIVGGIVVGLLSDSKTSVSGPAAGLTVIVLGAINSLGDFYTFTVSVFIAGLIQLLFGFLKAGRLGGYFPNSVIKGMLAAIGIILILKQIPHAVGFDADFMGDESFFQNDGENTFTEIFKAFNFFNLTAITISGLSLLSLFIWDHQVKKKNKFFEFLPAPLFVVVLGIALNEIFLARIFGIRLDKTYFVSLPNITGLTSFLSEIQWPDWDGLFQVGVYKVAITLAIVASLETMLSIEAVDKIDPHKNVTNKDREFIAQGLGNMLSGLIGALPVTSVIVRSSANIGAGSVSKLSSIMHGVWLLVSVMFFVQWLELIPLAALAAILIHVGFKLCKPSLFKQIYKQGKAQLIPFVITILAILFTDLLVGIGIGIATGFVFILTKNLQKSIVVVHEGEDYLIRFMKDVSFLSKPEMMKIFSEIPSGSAVVIDGTNHVNIDNDVIVIIEDFLEVCSERNIKYELLKSSFAINPFFKETNENS
jgi:MFS superfamily sulfate permease-like transporter